MGIASQKLMSFLLATTALSDIVHAVVDVFADALLTGEAEGFAIDATGITASPAYVGAPEAGYISIKEYDSPAALMSNLPLDDPRSPLVQSGTSPKLVRYHSDNGDSPGSDYPLLRWTPHNLVPQSQTFDTTWALASTGNISVSSNSTTAPDGSSTASTLTATDTSNCGIQYSNPITFLAGAAYTLSIYVKDNGTNDHILLQASDRTANAAGYYFNISAGTVGTSSPAGTGSNVVPGTITSVGSGWYRCQITVSFSADNSAVDFALYVTNADNSLNCDSGQGTYIWGAQLVRGYNANPYLVTTTAARIGIPVEYDTAESKYGILVEPEATNLALRSEDLSTTWTADAVTATTDQTTAPDGATTADKIDDGAANSRHIIYQQVTTAAGTCVASVFLKNGDRQFAAITFETASTDGATHIFDLVNGTITDSKVGGAIANSSQIVNIGNGWYRCSVTCTFANANPYMEIGLSDSGTPAYTNLNATYAGSSKFIYIWGAQVETGSVATSYVPTLSATSTRARDNINVTLSSTPVTATPLSCYEELKLLRQGPTNSMLAEFDDGDFSDAIVIYGTGLEYQIQAASGTTVDQIGTISITLGTAAKIGFRAITNDANSAKGGTVRTADTTCAMPTGLTTFRIGGADSTLSTNYQGVAMYYTIVVLPRALTNTELATVTT